MNIQNQPIGPGRSNPLRNDEAGKAEDAARSGDAGNAGAAEKAAATGDRVEISDAARQAQAGDATDAALVERGRQVLEASSLSEGRLAELKQRAESGYYTSPEATQQIAEGLAEDLGSA